MLLVYYTSSTGHNKQNFTQNTHTNCVSECVHVCILHYLPTEWSWLSALHTVNQRSASGQKNRALPSNTHRHTCVYTHTDTLRSADHKLPKHAVTANRQRGSAANNTGVREREREREIHRGQSSRDYSDESLYTTVTELNLTRSLHAFHMT